MQLVLPGLCAEGEQVVPVRSFDSSHRNGCNGASTDTEPAALGPSSPPIGPPV
jgi:hypothetical protein